LRDTHTPNTPKCVYMSRDAGVMRIARIARKELQRMKKDICDWLREYLAKNGPTDNEKVRAEAICAGYSKQEIREAKLICRIKSLPKTFWALPEELEK